MGIAWGRFVAASGWRWCLAVMALALGLSSQAAADGPEAALAGRAIVERAVAAAGGDTWLNPQTLHLAGRGIFYNSDGVVVVDDYQMWRVYDPGRDQAHKASGYVRIDAKRAGAIVFQFSFDGEHSYTEKGLVAGGANTQIWSDSFGFGIIRQALEENFTITRMPDDQVEGHPAYFVRVLDPKGEVTVFGVAKDDFAIRYVGFQTSRGWHHRHYADFTTQESPKWRQPGRVKLYYNGILANEIIWTDFTVNGPIARELFVLAPASGTIPLAPASGQEISKK